MATYNDEVCIVQRCTSTCVCSPTASDVGSRQIASPLAERIVTTPTICMLQTVHYTFTCQTPQAVSSIVQDKSFYMSCNALHQPFSGSEGSVVPFWSGSVLTHRNTQKHKSVCDLRSLEWIWDAPCSSVQKILQRLWNKDLQKCVCLQKIYLFAPEGSTQDRSRSRPPPAPVTSPAKRAKTGNLDEEEQEEQLREADEPRREEHQTQQAEADEMAAERSSTSENLNCMHVLSA